MARFTAPRPMLLARVGLAALLLGACTAPAPAAPAASGPTAVASAPAATPSVEATILAGLEDYLARRAEADLFSGAVLLAQDDRLLFARAYGLASQAFGVPNGVDTRFTIASVQKMFTAVAVAQMAEQGKLRFDDPIARHLPDYPGPAAERITIHQLLTHTSGLGDIFTERYWAAKDSFRAPRDYLATFSGERLKFDPGTGWAYSNAGYVVLGAIIEAASGEAYADYLQAHLFAPAGMHDTGAQVPEVDVPHLATGYTRADISGGRVVGPPGPGPRRNTLRVRPATNPAGGGYSTVGDLWRFALALQGHRLLSPASTELLLRGQADTTLGRGVRYGYGFVEATVLGTRVVGHGGGFPGTSAHFDMYPERGYVVAVLSNYDPPAAADVGERLRAVLP